MLYYRIFISSNCYLTRVLTKRNYCIELRLFTSFLASNVNLMWEMSTSTSRPFCHWHCLVPDRMLYITRSRDSRVTSGFCTRTFLLDMDVAVYTAGAVLHVFVICILTGDWDCWESFASDKRKNYSPLNRIESYPMMCYVCRNGTTLSISSRWFLDI